MFGEDCSLNLEHSSCPTFEAADLAILVFKGGIMAWCAYERQQISTDGVSLTDDTNGLAFSTGKSCQFCISPSVCV